MDISVEVVSYACGGVNAFYDRDENRVELCSELFVSPELTRAVLNHELAHAFFDQHGLNDALDGVEEFNADELSWFFDRADETLAIERFFLVLAQYEGDEPSDEHPLSLDRAAMFICLDAGAYDDEDAQCRAYLNSAQDKWGILVTAPRVE